MNVPNHAKPSTDTNSLAYCIKLNKLVKLLSGYGNGTAILNFTPVPPT